MTWKVEIRRSNGAERYNLELGQAVKLEISDAQDPWNDNTMQFVKSSCSRFEYVHQMRFKTHIQAMICIDLDSNMKRYIYIYIH